MEKKKINVMEVCPRDGWQSLPDVISTETKKYYIQKMLDTGIKRMQICSFVSPKAIPQMIDAKEVSSYFIQKYPDVVFDALVPNLRGASNAVESGFKEVSYVISVSTSHNLANIRSTHEKSKAGLEEIRKEFPDLNVTLALATTFGCPFEGEVPFEKVMEFVDYGYDLGIRSFELADTIGVATPLQVQRYFSTIREKYPEVQLTSHMHDTRNNGVINSWMAAMHGADIIHTSLGGLGGCPFAPGASGNTSSEDFVYLLNRDGFETGIDVYAMIEAAKEMKEHINGVYSGHHVTIGFDKYEHAVREQKEAAAE